MTKTKEVVEEETTLENVFTQEQLLQAWENFITENQTKLPAFTAGISLHKPQLRDNFVIEIELENNLVMQDKNGMTQLRESLRNQLKNNVFKIVERITEHHVELKAFTDRERLNDMVNKNPNLKELIKELKLTLD